MKTAIYIEDGIVQLVLTPENEFEKNALGSFSGPSLNAKVFKGQFYDCQGGWTRHKDTPRYLGEVEPDKTDRSLIIRMEAAA